MSNLVEILIVLVSAIVDRIGMFLSSSSMELALGGSGVTFAFALVAGTASISEGVLSTARRWHGSIDDQFGNINNFVTLVLSH
jgi:hypothetical protein